jgi:hypothetical protein
MKANVQLTLKHQWSEVSTKFSEAAAREQDFLSELARLQFSYHLESETMFTVCWSQLPPKSISENVYKGQEFDARISLQDQLDEQGMRMYANMIFENAKKFVQRPGDHTECRHIFVMGINLTKEQIDIINPDSDSF